MPSRWRRIHLCTAILVRGDALLMVASKYPNHPEPLWNLPGGRQEDDELLHDTLAREVLEETSLRVSAHQLAYVSESYDPDALTHFLNVTFEIQAAGDPVVPAGDAHALACEWVSRHDVAARLRVGVVREPLVAYLHGDRSRYYGYQTAGITIEFND